MSDLFYKAIAGFHHFPELGNPAHFCPAPADWQVVICDVAGSTKAIAAGRYKDVNMAGAAAIIAVLNAADGVDLPYAFGGDGATILIPSRLAGPVKAALEAVQDKIQQMFGLEMRAGLMPLSALYGQGTTLSVARFYLSPDMSQAVFSGTALSLAEAWLKQGGGEAVLCRPSAHSPDLKGLECRWEPIANRNGMMLSLIVKVLPAHRERELALYSDILRMIGTIYGDEARPVTPGNTTISFSPRRLWPEVALRGGSNAVTRLLYLIRILLLNLVGRMSFDSGKELLGFDGKRYLSEMAANSDSRKFDEALRMILDSTPEQRLQLEAALEHHRQAGEVVYGLHASNEALMTCLVFSLEGNHVHFVDGADGGYALAALQMKQQLAQARAYD